MMPRGGNIWHHARRALYWSQLWCQLGAGVMRDLIFPVQHDSTIGLQTQLRRHLVDAIIDGRLSAKEPLPSCRRLSKALGISRNTVVLAYQALVDDGMLISNERVGYFVNSDMVRQRSDPAAMTETPPAARPKAVGWWDKLQIRSSTQVQITKPKNWHDYPYPFIYGQMDPALFPVTNWRMCSRQALALDAIEDWSEDSFEEDDPMLIEEVRTRVLPRRGIKARPDEILITLGAQNALYLVGRLLLSSGSVIGFEDPGYVDARNIFGIMGAKVKALPVDDDGMIVDQALGGCDVAYLTPSHQSPTTVTMVPERRRQLLERAAADDFIIIEDDYEAETSFASAPLPALKARDHEGRVVYVGSFSKYLAPGLRVGYIVGPRDFIREARLLRRLVLRHPPANNQRTLALFIAGGYYDALVSRLQRAYHERWSITGEALEQQMGNLMIKSHAGASSFWIEGPAELDSDILAREALGRGVVIEPGSVFFLSSRPPRNFMRLGFSSIKPERIPEGIGILANLIRQSL